MSIREEGSNFPAVLGFKNKIPFTVRSRPGLGQQAMALVRGENPMHLAQHTASNLPPFNTPGLGSILLPQMRGREPLTKRIIDRLASKMPLLGQTVKNIPFVYERPGFWKPTRRISDIPSVTGILDGPERTVHPQIHMSVAR